MSHATKDAVLTALEGDDSDLAAFLRRCITTWEQRQEQGAIHMVCPTVGKVKQWAMTDAHLTTLRDAFPNTDILGEARKAAAWIEANPTKRKTAKGMPAFLFTWLSRAVNSDTRRPASRPAPQPTYDGDWFEECKRLHNNGCNGQYEHAVKMGLA